MVTEASWRDWTPDDLRPYVQHAVEWFGPDRCLFGSDWPVCLLAATYDRVIAALKECVNDMRGADTDAVFGGNAIRVYRLAV
jgi:L-fuconolactonase